MADRRYKWKRFWCPPTGRINLSDGGYLFDPDCDWGPDLNPDVVSFDALADTPCLVLIGEPGMGKSVEMKGQYELLGRQLQAPSDRVLSFDLRDYQTDLMLHQKVFAHPALADWAAGDHRLHLFLDSLDEGLLSVETLATSLPTELAAYCSHLHRLHFRIAGRTAQWPRVLESSLRDLWGEDAVRIYELAPLREIDVAEAAEVNGLAAEKFLEEVARRDAGPLASKPVTLDFLLRAYSKEGTLPPTRKELYEKGCSLLCAEVNESRVARSRRGQLTADQRLLIAGRLAAVTVLANRAAIWTEPDRGGVPDSDVTLDRLSGWVEETRDKRVRVEVTHDAIRETLDTGLFSSRGGCRMGWAHQSYAEFLTAWYVSEHRMSAVQMRSLTAHPGDPNGKLVPQLTEAAAWLADMSSEVYDYILEADPQVLLRSDVTTADPRERERLVAGLLGLLDSGNRPDLDLSLRQGYWKLQHPGLAHQLRPYVLDRRKNWRVRRAAIEIADACELRELEAELLSVALDCDDDYQVRSRATYALVDTANEETKARLRPLALGEAGEDPDDELRGNALRCVWPRHLSTEELFRVLTSPKNPNLYGAYAGFLDHLGQALEAKDLPVALEWVKAHPDWGLVHPFRRLVDDIVERAWDWLESPGVLPALADAVVESLRKDHCIITEHGSQDFAKKVESQEARRRCLLSALLPLLNEAGARSLAVTPYGQIELATQRDLQWLIEQLDLTDGEGGQRVIAELIARLFIPTDPDQAGLVFVAAKRCSVLMAKVDRWFEAIRLDSPEFRRRYQDHLEMEEWRERAAARRLGGMTPSERISRCLDQIASGAQLAWWDLTEALTLDATGARQHGDFEPDLTGLPGWQTAEPGVRGRILAAARNYLLHPLPVDPGWIETSFLPWVELGAYKALTLLSREDPAFLDEMPPALWERWAPIVVAYPSRSETATGLHGSIVGLAHDRAPEAVLDSLAKRVRTEAQQWGTVPAVAAVDACWDARLAAVVLAEAKNEAIKPETLRYLLGDLIRRATPEAEAFARSLVTSPPPVEGSARERACAAACALACHAADAGWPVVWPAMQADSAFGRAVVAAIAGSFAWRTARLAERLSDACLADLYVWSCRQYPPGEDPDVHGAHAVGPRESIARWRDSLLAQLKGRAAQASCDELRRIVRELPELEWLKWQLLEAEDLVRRSTWVPPAPEQILRLSRDSQLRIVETEGQLLDAIMESLARLQVELDRGSAAHLWNEEPNCQPKDEMALSNYVAAHLQRDLVGRGVIANREVQIRPGQRPDVLVQAFIRDQDGEPRDVMAAIIEAKGCWHRYLYADLERQLVKRYMKANHCRYGLYLVGWFGCERWNPGDTRLKLARRRSIDVIRHRLGEAAAAISTHGMRVEALVLDVTLH